MIIKELFEGPVGDYCIARNTIKCLLTFLQVYPKYPIFMYKYLKLTEKASLFSGSWILWWLYKTDERESPQEAWPARENSNLCFIEAVHQ